MPKLDVLNLAGKKVGEIELADEVFDAEVKEHLFWEMVTAQRAAKRSGSACTKERSEVRGSGAKIYRQKGTGRARHGAKSAPIFVGGGTTFGPKPRSYEKKVLKKVRRSALISALSLRTQEKKLLVLDTMELPEIKTKNAVRLLQNLGVESGLLVDSKDNETLDKSIRNLPHSKYLAPEGLNVYDILRYDTLVLSAPVAKQIEERLKS